MRVHRGGAGRPRPFRSEFITAHWCGNVILILSSACTRPSIVVSRIPLYQLPLATDRSYLSSTSLLNSTHRSALIDSGRMTAANRMRG